MNLKGLSGNQYLTPLIEVNNNPYQYRTPPTGALGTTMATNNNATRYHQQNTPVNRRNLNFTPSCQTMLSTTLAGIPNATAMQMSNEPIYEQMQPEYALELIWSEPSGGGLVVGNDLSSSGGGGILSGVERASKFFQQIDFYSQRYVCYLLPQRNQLRCIRVEYNEDMDEFYTIGHLQCLSARDAVYVEQRQLMVVLDPQGSLWVYSGLSKLCKLHLSNIVWSSLSPSNRGLAYLQHHHNAMSNNNNNNNGTNRDQPSPIATPVKSNKLLFSADLSTVDMRSSVVTSSTTKVIRDGTRGLLLKLFIQFLGLFYFIQVMFFILCNEHSIISEIY